MNKATSFALVLVSLTLLLVGVIQIAEGNTNAPQTVWEKTFGAFEGYSVVQSNDGGYVVAATTGKYNPSTGGSWYNTSVVIFKTDASGEVQWTMNFSQGFPFSQRIISTKDGAFVVTGQNQVTIDAKAASYAYYSWLLKIDKNGNLQWNKTYATPAGYAYVNFLVQTNDEGYIFGGSLNPDAGPPFGQIAWIVKTNLTGDIEWAETYENATTANSLLQASDGGYVFAGGKDYEGSCLVKLDQSGTIVWKQIYDSNYYLNSVVESNGKGYVASDFSGYMIWTNLQGNALSSKNYSALGFNPRFESMFQTSDYGFLFSGSLNGAAFLTKTTSSNEVEWNATFQGKLDSVVQTKDGGYVFTGARGVGESSQIWMVRLSSEGIPELSAIWIAVLVFAISALLLSIKRRYG
jgi:hypothetical protein